jgi:hypothetical protein
MHATDDVHHMAVALDGAVGIHTHCAGLRHATQIIACQIHQHHMLGIFFWIGQQLPLVGQVRIRIGLARQRAGNGPQLRMAIVQLHQRLGR